MTQKLFAAEEFIVEHYQGKYTPPCVRILIDGEYLYDDDDIVMSWNSVKSAENYLRNNGYSGILVDGDVKTFINYSGYSAFKKANGGKLCLTL